MHYVYNYSQNHSQDNTVTLVRTSLLCLLFYPFKFCYAAVLKNLTKYYAVEQELYLAGILGHYLSESFFTTI